MARNRKTADQRRQERYEAAQGAWALFSPKLASVHSFKDAALLLSQAVAPDSPGRSYYANLGFFLQTFGAPDGANRTELSEYVRLLSVFDAEGLLKPGARATLEAGLRSALARKA